MPWVNDDVAIGELELTRAAGDRRLSVLADVGIVRLKGWGVTGRERRGERAQLRDRAPRAVAAAGQGHCGQSWGPGAPAVRGVRRTRARRGRQRRRWSGGVGRLTRRVGAVAKRRAWRRDGCGRDRAPTLEPACGPLRVLGVRERPADAFDQLRRHVRVAQVRRRHALFQLSDRRSWLNALGSSASDSATTITPGTPTPRPWRGPPSPRGSCRGWRSGSTPGTPDGRG